MIYLCFVWMPIRQSVSVLVDHAVYQCSISFSPFSPSSSNLPINRFAVSDGIVSSASSGAYSASSAAVSIDHCQKAVEVGHALGNPLEFVEQGVARRVIEEFAACGHTHDESIRQFPESEQFFLVVLPWSVHTKKDVGNLTRCMFRNSRS